MTNEHLTVQDFDTEALGLKTGKIAGECPSESLSKIVAEAAKESFELLFWSPSFAGEDDTNSMPEGVPGYLVCENVTLELGTVEAREIQGRQLAKSCSTPVTIDACSSDSRAETIVNLALIAGEKSRFKRDPCLTDYQYRKVYTKWAHNCLQRKSADVVFVASIGEKAAGMITLQDRNSFTTIGLLAVFPESQRRGVASALMGHALRWAAERGACTVRVTTQVDNKEALGLYNSFGLKPVSKTAIYHVWTESAVGVRQNVPYFAGKEIEYLTDLTHTQSIESCGKYTDLCRKKIGELLQCPHVLLTGSATAALEQAMILCDVGPGDEVIIPSYTFVSTANAVALRGATPVFVDVGTDCQIDPARVEVAITPRTRCVIVVHYAGQSCDMDRIMGLAEEHGIFVVEDAAQGFLSTYKGRCLGTIGHIGCISFHYTKNTICGEGGALLVNHEPFRDRSYIIWEKGTNRFDFIQKKVNKYHWIDIGSSFVPSELCASFLFSQLEAAKYCQSRRLVLMGLYRQFLAGLEQAGHFRAMSVQGRENSENGHIFWIMLPSHGAKQKLQDHMAAKEIQLFEHYCPLHSSPGGVRFGRTDGAMTVTDEISTCLLRLPTYVQMTFVDAFKVIKGIHEHFNAVSPALSAVMHSFLDAHAFVCVNRR